MKQVLRILSRVCLFFVGFVFATLSAAQSPCIDGFADGYPCDRIDLLSQMSNETLMGQGVMISGGGRILSRMLNMHWWESEKDCQSWI